MRAPLFVSALDAADLSHLFSALTANCGNENSKPAVEAFDEAGFGVGGLPNRLTTGGLHTLAWPLLK